MSRSFKIALGVLVGVVLVIIAVAWRAGAFDDDYKRPAKTAARAVAVPDGPTLEVTGRELYEAYRRDVAAAEATYRGKLLRVHCVVGEGHGTTSLDIEAASGADHMEAWFTDESAAAMRKLKHYDEVFLRCRGGGMFDVVTLRDCVLEQVVPK